MAAKNIGLDLTPELARAVGFLVAAGFDGYVDFRVDVVMYPGGSYEYGSVTVERIDGAVKEAVDANLFAKYPTITVTELGRLGMFAPIGTPKPDPLEPGAPVTASTDPQGNLKVYAQPPSIFGGGK